MVSRLTDADGSEVAHLRTPLRLSEGDVSVRSLAPALGADTEAVLHGAGYSAADIDALRADGVI
jgi:crotonobetainyl-CoA:carnitine CoA-transferase CaiB-like acyl-CoA transferase